MPEIETARLRFRMPSSHDLDALLLLFSDPQVVKFMGVVAGTTLTREETRFALEKMVEFWEKHGLGRWAVVSKDNNQVIGLCGYRLLDTTPELFYMFTRATWGLGMATEAARATLRYGFEELGSERIIAVTRPANTASIRVMTKIGMKYEKEMNHFGVHAVCYALTRDEYQPDDAAYILSRD